HAAGSLRPGAAARDEHPARHPARRRVRGPRRRACVPRDHVEHAGLRLGRDPRADVLALVLRPGAAGARPRRRPAAPFRGRRRGGRPHAVPPHARPRRRILRDRAAPAGRPRGGAGRDRGAGPARRPPRRKSALMEREILFTGIGGQGIQLMAKVLAQAAADDGKHAMLFGLYGGAMRGGPSDSTVVIGDQPIEAPPIVPACWSIVAMHPSALPALLPKLRPGGLLFANETLVQVAPPARVTAIPI